MPFQLFALRILAGLRTCESECFNRYSLPILWP